MRRKLLARGIKLLFSDLWQNILKLLRMLRMDIRFLWSCIVAPQDIAAGRKTVWLALFNPKSELGGIGYERQEVHFKLLSPGKIANENKIIWRVDNAWGTAIGWACLTEKMGGKIMLAAKLPPPLIAWPRGLVYLWREGDIVLELK